LNFEIDFVIQVQAGHRCVGELSAGAGIGSRRRRRRRGGGGTGGARRVSDPGERRALGQGGAGCGVRARPAEIGEDLADHHAVGDAHHRHGRHADAARKRARQEGGARRQPGQHQRRHRHLQGLLGYPAHAGCHCQQGSKCVSTLNPQASLNHEGPSVIQDPVAQTATEEAAGVHSSDLHKWPVRGARVADSRSTLREMREEWTT